VVRAIFACRIPTVSAVGHETDVTLADFVADMRAPTPSAAAELVTPDIREVVMDVQNAARALSELMQDRLEEHSEDTDTLVRTLERHSPLHRVTQYRQRTDDRARALGDLLTHRLMRERGQLAHRQASLVALDPQAVLARGYALVTDAATGTVLRVGGDGYAGRAIRVRVAAGAFGATATGSIVEGEGNGDGE